MTLPQGGGSCNRTRLWRDGAGRQEDIRHTKLHTARWTLHTAHCTLHTAHYQLFTEHCPLCTLHCTLHTAHYILHTEHCTLHTTCYTQHTTHYTLYTAHCTLDTFHYSFHVEHCALHTTHSPLYARVSPKAPLVMLKLLPCIFLSPFLQYFRFLGGHLFLTIFSTLGNFWPIQNHKGPPLG